MKKNTLVRVAIMLLPMLLLSKRGRLSSQ